MHCLKGVVSHLAFFAITFHHDLAAIADKHVIKVFNSQNLPSHMYKSYNILREKQINI